MSELDKPELITSSLLGAAAEHYVMCQLLRRGRLAALAPAGMPFADILVSNARGGALSAVQVKARTKGADGGWHMSKKHESLKEALYVYCFVDFGMDLGAQPRCWIVPSEVVAKALSDSHRAWLGQPGKNGVAHNDTLMRRMRPDYDNFGLLEYPKGWMEKYENAWNWIAAAGSAANGDQP